VKDYLERGTEMMKDWIGGKRLGSNGWVRYLSGKEGRSCPQLFGYDTDRGLFSSGNMGVWLMRVV
jgi:hypothetical protein